MLKMPDLRSQAGTGKECCVELNLGSAPKHPIFEENPSFLDGL